MSASGTVLPVVVVAWSCLLVACPKDKKNKTVAKTAIGQVVVEDHTRGDLRVAALTRDRLEKRVTNRLTESGHWELSGDKERGYRIRIDLGLRRDGDDLTALASARAEPGVTKGATPFQASGSAKLVKGRAARVAEREAHLLSVLDRAVGDVNFQAMLWRAPPSRLVKALTNPEIDLQRLAAAIELAAVRRVKQAVPALIRLLKHDRQQISDRCIGALVAIGDRRAVRPLTRLSKFSDTARMAKVIDAIGSLGGKEAKDYLEFVAVGHEDADIRNLAREALERMRR